MEVVDPVSFRDFAASERENAKRFGMIESTLARHDAVLQQLPAKVDNIATAITMLTATRQEPESKAFEQAALALMNTAQAITELTGEIRARPPAPAGADMVERLMRNRPSGIVLGGSLGVTASLAAALVWEWLIRN